MEYRVLISRLSSHSLTSKEVVDVPVEQHVEQVVQVPVVLGLVSHGECAFVSLRNMQSTIHQHCSSHVFSIIN